MQLPYAHLEMPAALNGAVGTGLHAFQSDHSQQKDTALIQSWWHTQKQGKGCGLASLRSKRVINITWHDGVNTAITLIMWQF